MSKFIVLEGIDGSGTTTHSKLLAERLTSEGYDVLRTNEPSTGEFGTLVRSLFTQQEPMPDWQTMALLFTADRMDHLKKVIEPALSTDKIVICDRYYYSAVGYQSFYATDSLAHYTPSEWIKTLNYYARIPDLTLALTLPLAVVMQRLDTRKLDQFEKNSDLMEYLSEFYHLLPAWFREDNITTVNSNDEKDVVAEKIYQAVKIVLAFK